jgi:hypothetical protein
MSIFTSANYNGSANFYVSGYLIIGSDAFKNSTTLTRVTISPTIQSIESNAFYNCVNLTEVTFEGFNTTSSLTKIGDNAFSLCMKLRSIVIPLRLLYIGNSAFKSCSLLASVIVYPFYNNLKSIGYEAFSNCPLTNIVIPETVTSIGINAFQSTSNLALITFLCNEPIITNNNNEPIIYNNQIDYLFKSAPTNMIINLFNAKKWLNIQNNKYYNSFR